MAAIKVRRLGYALGAEITGLDLTREIDDATVAEIYRVWMERIVLCFPGQDLDPAQMSAFARRFGELDDNRQNPQARHPEHPAIFVLVNKRIDSPLHVDSRYSGNINNNWHTDLSYTDRPVKATLLNAKELPGVGGDTMFANQYMAYEALSPGMQRLAESLEAVHDVACGITFRRQSPEVQAERRQRNPPHAHPVVRVHPETGRKALYLGERVRKFVGLTDEESAPLLDFLNAHATRHEFVYRHRWTLSDVLMWDNRCALHYAVPDYDQRQLRRMQRCTILGAKMGYLYSDETDRLAAASA